MQLPDCLLTDRGIAGPTYFAQHDGSRISDQIYSSPEIYALEQDRIFRGQTWSFVALEAELPNPRDFKSTFVGDTPVVVTRNSDSGLSGWVNRCAHRGCMVCREAAATHAVTSASIINGAMTRGQSEGSAVSERHQGFPRTLRELARRAPGGQ
jgi:anthranilate 1,2-dioxygenase large subunit